jgi:hypothetical protein
VGTGPDPSKGDQGGPLDFAAIRAAWDTTLAAPRRFEEAARALFREFAGIDAPSSVVRSAEGVTQFGGLYESGNGLLSAVARQALQHRLGTIDPEGRFRGGAAVSVGSESRLIFTQAGDEAKLVPGALAEIPLLRGLGDIVTLAAVADCFSEAVFAPGESVVKQGQPIDAMFVIVQGQATRVRHEDDAQHASAGLLGEGEYFGDNGLKVDGLTWDVSITAASRCAVLTLTREAFHDVAASSEALLSHLKLLRASSD